MTHDELLARIDEDEKFLEQYFGGKFKGQSALRAVVELHKPFQFENAPELYKPVCQHCQLGAVGDVYPCETIYAIEKELA